MIEIITESIAKEKTKHFAAIGASGTGATVAATSPVEADNFLNAVLFWLPHSAVLAGFMLSCALLYKTYLEIKLARAALEED